MPHQQVYVDVNASLIHCATGAVLEGFLRFPETTQDFPSMMGVPLSATTFHEAYTAG